MLQARAQGSFQYAIPVRTVLPTLALLIGAQQGPIPWFHVRHDYGTPFPLLWTSRLCAPPPPLPRASFLCALRHLLCSSGFRFTRAIPISSHYDLADCYAISLWAAPLVRTPSHVYRRGGSQRDAVYAPLPTDVFAWNQHFWNAPDGNHLPAVTGPKFRVLSCGGGLVIGRP